MKIISITYTNLKPKINAKPVFKNWIKSVPFEVRDNNAEKRYVSFSSCLLV